MRKSILFYELVGIAFIVIVGSMLHFTFELSGRNPIVGIFSAVNESVWEHLKLAFWPALLYAILERKYIRSSSFWLAKAVGIYLMPLAIAVFFYSYTAVLGESVLIIDILIFVMAVVIGQMASYRLLKLKLPERLERIALVVLIVLGVAFLVFTFYPPELFVFRDGLTGEYGVG